MGRVYLLDTTLRDGGYINEWRFGRDTIRGFGQKLARTGVELFEVGFLKGSKYDEECSMFPTTASVKNVIMPKSESMKYVVMLDMSAPVPMEAIAPCDEDGVDGIRVIFKKDKIDEAYQYCKRIQELGYFISVNFVGTDLYTDKEFIDGIEKFNALDPFAVSIVDSFGLIKRKQFLRLVHLADNNLKEGIALSYHAHNNLQQAFGNAEALVEMNLQRDVIIDACVYGMGRGAGNLNMELFAEYMNENRGTSYRIEPMLEIMDEYLTDIYKEKQWGYSLPFYLSASNGCHPNYAIYFAERDSLTAKAFGEILQGMSVEDKARFSRENAEKYYRKYLNRQIDDSAQIKKLKEAMEGRNVVVLAPGRSIREHAGEIAEACRMEQTAVIAVNFIPDMVQPDYIFSNNMKRFNKIRGKTEVPCITTSNMADSVENGIVVDFEKYAPKDTQIMDNSGLMLLRLLQAIGIRKAYVAGMDGYSEYYGKDYYDRHLEYAFSYSAEKRNSLISKELQELQKEMKIEFLTPTYYEVGETLSQ